MRKIFFGSFASGLGTVCGLIVLTFVIFVPVFSSYDPGQISSGARLLAPSWQHWMGTDDLGRDVLVRLAVGGRLSLFCAVVAVVVAAAIGLVLGALAGYLGSWADAVIMRVADALQAFPQILLALLIAFSLGGGMVPTTIAVAVSYWPYFAKISRGLVLSMRGSSFVLAAVAQGARTPYVVRRHLLPRIYPPLITQMTMAVPEAVITISGLSLIGLGAQDPTAEWGAIIAESAGFIFQAWWYPAFAGLALFLAALSFNLLGDSLRENLHLEGPLFRRGNRVGGEVTPPVAGPSVGA
jgi:peptide/nickel transport system permease protein